MYYWLKGIQGVFKRGVITLEHLAPILHIKIPIFASIIPLTEIFVLNWSLFIFGFIEYDIIECYSITKKSEKNGRSNITLKASRLLNCPNCPKSIKLKNQFYQVCLATEQKMEIMNRVKSVVELDNNNYYLILRKFT